MTGWNSAGTTHRAPAPHVARGQILPVGRGARGEGAGVGGGCAVAIEYLSGAGLEVRLECPQGDMAVGGGIDVVGGQSPAQWCSIAKQAVPEGSRGVVRGRVESDALMSTGVVLSPRQQQCQGGRDGPLPTDGVGDRDQRQVRRPDGAVSRLIGQVVARDLLVGAVVAHDLHMAQPRVAVAEIAEAESAER